MSFRFYLSSAIAVMVLFLIAGMLAWLMTDMFHKFSHRRLKRKLSVSGYQCFYLKHNDMLRDNDALRLLMVARKAYEGDSPLNSYYTSLSEQRLPMTVLANWSRTIAEDVFCAASPEARVVQWSRYMESKVYAWEMLVHSDFPEYEEHEFSFLWGAVFFWLSVCLGVDVHSPMMEGIVRLGCRKKYTKPFFNHFYLPASEMTAPSFGLPSATAIHEAPKSFVIASKQDGTSPLAIRIDELKEGFLQLSVEERRSARRVLNDLLPGCAAWQMLLRQLRREGCFHEEHRGADIIVSQAEIHVESPGNNIAKEINYGKQG